MKIYVVTEKWLKENTKEGFEVDSLKENEVILSFDRGNVRLELDNFKEYYGIENMTESEIEQVIDKVVEDGEASFNLDDIQYDLEDKILVCVKQVKNSYKK